MTEQKIIAWHVVFENGAIEWCTSDCDPNQLKLGLDAPFLLTSLAPQEELHERQLPSGFLL